MAIRTRITMWVFFIASISAANVIQKQVGEDDVYQLQVLKRGNKRGFLIRALNSYSAHLKQ